MKIWLFFPLFLISALSLNALAEAEVQENRLFFTPQERQQVLDERRAYLGKSAEADLASAATNQSSKPQSIEKKILPPKKMAVSGVIISPSGQKYVRVNDNFAPLNSPVVSLNQQKTQGNTAVFQIKGKEVEIPVGNTYFPQKQSLIETYKVQKEEAQAKALLQMPKKTESVTAEPIVAKPGLSLDFITGGLE